MSGNEGAHCSNVTRQHRSCLAPLADWLDAHLSPLGVMASRMTCMRALWRSIACTAATAPAATIAPVSVGLFVSCTSKLHAQALHAIPEPRMQAARIADISGGTFGKNRAALDSEFLVSP